MSLLYDFLRVENIIHGGAVTKEYQIQWVDEVLLPVFSGRRHKDHPDSINAKTDFVFNYNYYK
ncbi:hypothetical protein P4H66_04065 [Paenibacillus dokdonensis]|uniref:Uncharacterized protein n=1 Tax=Paenibacillus dokdonensis TaxID=2567944 RepID=A0ABU6GH41_9BACL|nr:hypothetical protein [Paenibacillus dokdonensis]MEC0239046.1 hypothetical protein [Paenibacillus dokdonensis]